MKRAIQSGFFEIPGAKRGFSPHRRSSSRHAFTLMEVMIACGILFMCLFGVLALTSNSLRTARALQQHKAVDVGTLAGVIYTTIANTNQSNEGEIPVDLHEILPGYECHAYETRRESNGLCQVDFEIERNNQLVLTNSFLIFDSHFKEGISQTLRQH